MIVLGYEEIVKSLQSGSKSFTKLIETYIRYNIRPIFIFDRKSPNKKSNLRKERSNTYSCLLFTIILLENVFILLYVSTRVSPS